MTKAEFVMEKIASEFGKAFAAARAQGLSTFSYGGKSFNTKLDTTGMSSKQQTHAEGTFQANAITHGLTNSLNRAMQGQVPNNASHGPSLAARTMTPSPTKIDPAVAQAQPNPAPMQAMAPKGPMMSNQPTSVAAATLAKK